MYDNMEELIDFARKGIKSEIEKEKSTIRRGYNLINAINAGEKVPTKLTIPEIQAIINKSKKKIELLVEKDFEYSWNAAIKRSENK